MSITERLRGLVPKRAPVAPDPPGVTVPMSLVRSAKLAAWMAYFALVYFLLLYTLDIARDRSGAVHITHIGTWIGEVFFYLPYVFGFAVVAVGIPYVAKIAIPVFMTLDWRTNLWPKMWALFIATAVSLVVIAGTFTVQGDTLLERDRESAVAVAQVEQSNAVLQAQIAAKEAELRSMMENRNAYLAQAASVGATEWQSGYIDQTSANDPQRERIVRALGAARAADTLRSDIAALRSQSARATTAEAVASRVTTADTSWIAATLGWLEGARAILLSLVMDIVCLIMPWIALRLQQARNRQLATSAEASPASEAVMIEDLREEAPVAAEPMRPAKRRARDGETGDPLTFVEGHWRRTTEPKRAKPRMRKDKDGVEVEAPAGVIRLNGDEIGLAAAAAGVVMAPSVAAEAPEFGPATPAEEITGSGNENNDVHQNSAQEEITLPPDVLNAIADLNARAAQPEPAPEEATAEEPPDPAHTLPNNEGVLVDEDEVYGPPAPVRRDVMEDA